MRVRYARRFSRRHWKLFEPTRELAFQRFYPIHQFGGECLEVLAHFTLSIRRNAMDRKKN